MYLYEDDSHTNTVSINVCQHPVQAIIHLDYLLKSLNQGRCARRAEDVRSVSGIHTKTFEISSKLISE
jgi:hypothetical protein